MTGFDSSHGRLSRYNARNSIYQDAAGSTLSSDKGRRNSHAHHKQGRGPFRIFHPTERFINMWNLLIVVTVLYVSFTVPISISVYWWKTPSPMYYIQKATDIIFMVDLLLHFRTGFIDHHGHLEMDWKHIAEHYLRFWFWFDILATIPWSWFIYVKDAKYVKYAKLPKLLRLGTLFRLLSAHVRFYGITSVLGVLVLGGHIGACVWISFLYSDDRCGPDPCGAAIIDNPCCQDVWPLYTQFLRATIAMLLLNLDDMSLHLHAGTWIAAYDVLEIVLVIIGVIIVGLVVSELQILVNLNDAEGKEFTQNLVVIGHEMERLYVPDHLRQKILCYFDYYWLNQSYFGELRVLQDRRIPTHVRQQVAWSIYKKHLKCVPFITDTLTTSEKECISLELTHRVYLPGDFVTIMGELANGEMYILAQGKLAVEIPGEDGTHKLLAILEAGAFIGEISILQETRRTASLRAMVPVEILVLAASSLRKYGLLHRDSSFHKSLSEFVKDRLERSKRLGSSKSQDSRQREPTSSSESGRSGQRVMIMGSDSEEVEGRSTMRSTERSSVNSKKSKRSNFSGSRRSTKIAVPETTRRFTSGSEFLVEVVDNLTDSSFDEKGQATLTNFAGASVRQTTVTFATQPEVSHIHPVDQYDTDDDRSKSPEPGRKSRSADADGVDSAMLEKLRNELETERQKVQSLRSDVEAAREQKKEALRALALAQREEAKAQSQLEKVSASRGEDVDLQSAIQEAKQYREQLDEAYKSLGEAEKQIHDLKAQVEKQRCQLLESSAANSNLQAQLKEKEAERQQALEELKLLKKQSSAAPIVTNVDTGLDVQPASALTVDQTTFADCASPQNVHVSFSPNLSHGKGNDVGGLQGTSLPMQSQVDLESWIMQQSSEQAKSELMQAKSLLVKFRSLAQEMSSSLAEEVSTSASPSPNSPNVAIEEKEDEAAWKDAEAPAQAVKRSVNQSSRGRNHNASPPRGTSSTKDLEGTPSASPPRGSHGITQQSASPEVWSASPPGGSPSVQDYVATPSDWQPEQQNENTGSAPETMDNNEFIPVPPETITDKL